MTAVIKFLKEWRLAIFLAALFLILLAALKIAVDARVEAEKQAAVSEAVAAEKQAAIDYYKQGLEAYEGERRKIREEVRAVSRSLATETIDRDAEALNVDPADLFNSRYADLNSMFYDATSEPGEATSSAAGTDSSAEH